VTTIYRLKAAKVEIPYPSSSPNPIDISHPPALYGSGRIICHEYRY
jgi:hypothetical protein